MTTLSTLPTTGSQTAPREKRRPPPKHLRRDRLFREELRQAAQVSLAQATVAHLYGTSLSDLRAPTRGKAPVAFARQIAMYLSHVVFGMSLSAVGRQFDRDRTTAAHACRCIEDKRDDTDFDYLLDRLEVSIRRVNLDFHGQTGWEGAQ